MELSSGTTVEFPSRWVLYRDIDHATAVSELGRLSSVLLKGSEAIAGVYMRLCDLIRSGPLTDAEVRQTLGQHFPQPRVSEILRVSRAPAEVYSRYTTGFFGFKAALRECRGYQVTPSQELKQRKARRAAERLAVLIEPPATFRVRDRVIVVSVAG